MLAPRCCLMRASPRLSITRRQACPRVPREDRQPTVWKFSCGPSVKSSSLSPVIRMSSARTLSSTSRSLADPFAMLIGTSPRGPARVTSLVVSSIVSRTLWEMRSAVDANARPRSAMLQLPSAPDQRALCATSEASVASRASGSSAPAACSRAAAYRLASAVSSQYPAGAAGVTSSDAGASYTSDDGVSAACEVVTRCAHTASIDERGQLDH
jgi:hypothetical protein